VSLARCSALSGASTRRCRLPVSVCWRPQGVKPLDRPCADRRIHPGNRSTSGRHFGGVRRQDVTTVHAGRTTKDGQRSVDNRDHGQRRRSAGAQPHTRDSADAVHRDGQGDWRTLQELRTAWVAGLRHARHDGATDFARPRSASRWRSCTSGLPGSTPGRSCWMRRIRPLQLRWTSSG
jgi:hypothetical protein